MRFLARALFGKTAITALATLLPVFLLSLLLPACSDSGTLTPEVDALAFARVTAVDADPSVTATDPDEAPQDTTLQVLVLGSNFDRGSTVEFGHTPDGGEFVPSEKVKAGRVKYVNANRLEAMVTVAVDAELALYDVAVTSARGKKGIGTEMFKVIEKIKTNSGQFELLSYSVQPAANLPEGPSGPVGFTLDPDVNTAVAAYLDEGDPLIPNPAYPQLPLSWGDFLGCPLGPEGCSAITFVMNPAKPEAFTMQVNPIAGGCGAPPGTPCLLDETLERREGSIAGGGFGLPTIPWNLIAPMVLSHPAGFNTFTFFWQGQRGMQYVWYDSGETGHGKPKPSWVWDYSWDRFPDLYPQGAPNHFSMRPNFLVGRNTWYQPTISLSFFMENCDAWPGCLAEYSGEPGLGPAEAGWLADPVGADGVFRFRVKATIDSPSNPNPESYARVMLTRPDGTRVMVSSEWTYHRDNTGLAATPFAVEGLDPARCHRFDLVGLTVMESIKEETLRSDVRHVWTGGTPPLFYPDGCGAGAE